MVDGPESTMKLRTKAFITLIPITILFVLISNFFISDIIMDDASKRDAQAAQDAAKRIALSLEKKIAVIDVLCADWSHWDDSWYFIQYGNASFDEEFLNVPTLEGSGLDLVLFYNTSGILIHGIAIDRVSSTEVMIPPSLLDIIEADTQMVYGTDENSSMSGFISYQNDSVIFASNPIMHSDYTGPVMGTLIMATHVDEEILTSLTETYGNPVRLGTDIGDPKLIANLGTDEVVIKNINDTTMDSSWLLADIYGKPALALDLELTRSWFLNGQVVTGYMHEVVIAAGLINFVLIMIFVDRAVLARLKMIIDDAGKISTGERKERRVQAKGNDELKELGVQINSMLENLDRSDQELVMRERRYRVVVEGSSNAILLVDGVDHSILEANPAFLKMTGLAPQSLSSMHITDVLNTPWAWETAGIGNNGNKVQEGEGTFKHFNGSTSNVDVTMSALTYEGKEVLYIIARDLTERRKGEKERERILGELRRVNEKLETTLKSIADGVITVDEQGHIILMNRAAEELSGRSTKEMVGKSISEVVALSEKGWTNFSSLNNGGPIKELIRNQSGKEWHIEYSFNTLIGTQGEKIGKMFTFRDVSQKVRAEMAEANAGRLESIGTLAGGIAHDFNNVMTSVMGELYLLRNEIASSEGSMKRSQERIHDMEVAMDRAKFVAQELLSLSKGGAPIQKPTALRVLLDETARLAFTGSNITWSLDCPADLWSVNIDKGQMNRAFLNILINAKEASPQGGSIEIVASNVKNESGNDSNNKFVRIDFVDHGSGIPPEMLTRIFDPYFTTKGKGTGLGLTVTYTTIKRHGGRLEVNSEVNKGTKMSIFLPAILENVEEVVRSDQPISGSGKILVMDDEETILDVTGEILQTIGYQVEVARNGEEALQRYKEAMTRGQPFDAVIMDLTIPGGMGGKDAVSLLLKIDPKARAIVSSGYSNDPVMSNYRNYGFVGVVPKPYSIDELVAVIKSALDQ